MSSVLPDFLIRSRYAHALALSTNLALAALLLWLLVRLAWLLLGVNPVARGAGGPPALPAQAAPEIQTPLANWHLFGNALPALDPRRSAQNAPESGSRLKLHGIYAGEDPARGRAIIADEQGQERSYAVGDELPGGAILAEVYPDKVMLRNGVSLESLRLPRDTPSIAGAVRSNPSPLPGGARRETPTPFVNPGIAPMNTAVDRNAPPPQSRRDPAQLARDIQVVPVLENGRFAGVRLSSTKEAALLTKLGLKPDDVVTAVNGIALDNPARGAELTQTLQHADRASVTVRRGGKPVTFDVRLRQ
jgi:general secretion pathway protein C